MSEWNRVRSFVASIVLGAAGFAVASGASAAELMGRAVLPAATFAPGPTSGQFTGGGNGFDTPFVNKQPVQGFSAVIAGPRKGTYLVMMDNGFGSKPSSPDSLLRVFALKPDFETGQVVPVNRITGSPLSSVTNDAIITLRDPLRRVPFTIVADGANYPGTSTGGATIPVDPAIRNGRLLTGADFDIESVRRAPDGTLWFGDEFGPYLLHTDGNGVVLEAPIALPNVRNLPTTVGGTVVNPLIQSPSNPQLGSAGANLPNSGGFEGMALNASRTKLYTFLEQAVTGDPVRERRILNEFSLNTHRYTSRTFGYLMDSPGNSVGDFTALTDREYLVIERDGGQGDASDPRFTSPARLKKIFKVDLDKLDANGNLVKEEVVDLLNIYDPRDVAADGRTKTVFTFPFQTIEDLFVIDNNTLLVINDNNFPFSAGRAFGVADNDEFILLHTAPLIRADDEDCDGFFAFGDDRGFWPGGHDHECRRGPF
jgi:hypothetical protein